MLKDKAEAEDAMENTQMSEIKESEIGEAYRLYSKCCNTVQCSY